MLTAPVIEKNGMSGCLNYCSLVALDGQKVQEPLSRLGVFGEPFPSLPGGSSAEFSIY